MKNRQILIFTLRIILRITWGKSFFSMLFFLFVDLLVVYFIAKIWLEKQNKVTKKEIQKIKREGHFILKKNITKQVILLFVIGAVVGNVYARYCIKQYNQTIELVEEVVNEKDYTKAQNNFKIIRMKDKNEKGYYIYYAKLNDIKSKSIVLVYTKQQLEVNSSVGVVGTFYEYAENTNKNLINLKKMYYGDNIVGYVYATDVIKICEGNTVSGTNTITLETIETFLGKNVQQNLGFELFKSLTFGTKIQNSEFKKVIEDLGISHLLAISGTHLVSMVMVLEFCLKGVREIWSRNVKENKSKIVKVKGKYIYLKKTTLICIIGVWIYILKLNCMTSILRAGTAFILSSFAVICLRKKDITNLICVSVLVNVILSPFRIFTTSFLLSYLAILSIYLNMRFIQVVKMDLYLRREKKKEKLKEKEKNIKNIKNTKKIKKVKMKKKSSKLTETILTGIEMFVVVNLYVIILNMYLFNKVSIFSMVSGILFSFIILFVYIINNVSVVCFNCLLILTKGFLSNVISVLLQSLLYLNTVVVNCINTFHSCVGNIFPTFQIYVTNISVVTIVKYLLVVEMVKLIYLSINKYLTFDVNFVDKYSHKAKETYLSAQDKKTIERMSKNRLYTKVNNVFTLVKYTSNKRCGFKKDKMIVRNICCVLLVSFFVFNNVVELFVKGYEYTDFKLSFIDVGQGDCSVIKYCNYNILVDSGGSETYDIGENVLLPYLLKDGVKSLDYVFISHLDSDHVNGLFSLFGKVKIKNVCIGKQFETSENMETLNRLCKKYVVNLIELKQGDCFTIGNLEVNVLFPTLSSISSNVLNNNCLVLKMQVYNKSVLFAGDVEKEAERKLCSLYGDGLKADILKVGHHGSKTSSTQEFLELVQPVIRLIGVGQNNKFGHPHEEVISRLDELNCEVFRTDTQGEIDVRITKRGKISCKEMV